MGRLRAALASLTLATGLACGVGGDPPVTGPTSGEGEGEGESPAEGEGEGPAVGEGEGETARDAGPPRTDACANCGDIDAGPAPDADAGGSEDAGGADAGGGDAGPPPDCELGDPCDPIPIQGFPYSDRRDTRDRPDSAIDVYSCAPDVDESGGEYVYRLEVDEPGLLTATLDERPGDGVDIDVHLLTEPRGDACLARDHAGISVRIDPGVYHLVADTWVSDDGEAYPGPYELTVGFEPAAGDPCAVREVDLAMFWHGCAPGIDCVERDGRVYLRTPSSGPVVKEAHLVTEAEEFAAGWPQSVRDGIERHYQLSEEASGYEMDRTEPWAPAGEGGSRWGQGSTGRPVPVLDEAWYVCMYWRDRPAGGTRVIVSNPDNGRAVVTSAGWETGPGSNEAVAGVSEEVHDWLGTRHRSVLTVGFAADEGLPLGPIDCE